jgi:hypothetical protein
MLYLYLEAARPSFKSTTCSSIDQRGLGHGVKVAKAISGDPPTRESVCAAIAEVKKDQEIVATLERGMHKPIDPMRERVRRDDAEKVKDFEPTCC